jgi:hypothetical protein
MHGYVKILQFQITGLYKIQKFTTAIGLLQSGQSPLTAMAEEQALVTNALIDCNVHNPEVHNRNLAATKQTVATDCNGLQEFSK